MDVRKNDGLTEFFRVLRETIVKTTINQVYKHVGEEVTIGA